MNFEQEWNLIWESGVTNFETDLSFSLYAILSTYHLITTSDSKNEVWNSKWCYKILYKHDRCHYCHSNSHKSCGLVKHHKNY